MAATLLLIKSRTLLPKRRQEEESETEDPRRELERSLEEFKRMKEIRAHIESLIREEEVYRTKEPAEIRSGLYTGKISLQKLSAAFFALYESLKEEETTIMEQEEVSLDDEMEELRFTLRRGGSGRADDIFPGEEDKTAPRRVAHGAFGASPYGGGSAP